ncbi:MULTISPECIES: hypothetical protein [unclassified Halomonas]|uniref:hypothetical protein n=1 Tax=unclassified Halomonas TaxID=2609666 RepID=UPI0007D98A32|nr:MULTISPECIES: hypothetical protein [unclassified Halomonas]MBT2786400.1 hypothetical protein [Halomonas sp. ISL-106]MBT2797422.1 hypothetical protein [Halomonas sp. ISL-104]OAL58786.1 hypothetical protein A6R74_07830 [Halomonas sp. ALS9]
MKLRLIVAASSLAILSGCATTPEACDPSQEASLLAKLSCDAGGGYRARIDAGEEQVYQDQEENALFRDIQRQIMEQQRATRNELRVTNQQQYELERTMEQLVARLQNRTQEQLGLQHQLSEVEQQVQAGSSSQEADTETFAEREERLNALQEQVNRLQQSLGYTP